MRRRLLFSAFALGVLALAGLALAEPTTSQVISAGPVKPVLILGRDPNGTAAIFGVTDAGAIQVTMEGAMPASLDLVAPDNTSTFDYDNCYAGSGDGGCRVDAGVSIPAGSYVMNTFDEEVFVCYAATCGSGGRRFAPSKSYLIQFDAAQSISCRSASATGDLQFSKLK